VRLGVTGPRNDDMAKREKMLHAALQ
jgi:hypothetical protein